MRKVGILVIIFAVIFTLFTPATNVGAAKKFKDVPDHHWAAEQIYYFAKKGVINGFNDGAFRPNQKITRAEAAIMLARGLKLDTKNITKVDYKDISPSHFAYKEIAAITNKGIMKGNHGKFNPNAPLTRAEMAIILTNAFDFKGNQSSSFKDVSKDYYAYRYIDAIYTNKITLGYKDHTFKPNLPTTRAQFAVFLGNAINNNNQELADYLKKVYGNELAVKSYNYEGSMNFGITLPQALLKEAPEMAMFAEMLKDIQIDVTGSYQKDPMMMDAMVNVKLSGDIQTTLSFPFVMTEEKMWIKLPQTPLFPLPEELDGKFIEFDFNELSALTGQATGDVNLDLQTKLMNAISHLFIDHFANDFYSEVDNDSIDIPNDVDVKKVIKFELTNETLKPFIETLFSDFLPHLLTLLENPEYAASLGLTPEDIKLAKEEIAKMAAHIDNIVAEVTNVLTINRFKEYAVINKDDYIAYNLMDIDVDITVEEETFGINLFFNQGKSNINEDVKFSIGIPNEADVIRFQEVMELENIAPETY